MVRNLCKWSGRFACTAIAAAAVLSSGSGPARATDLSLHQQIQHALASISSYRMHVTLNRSVTINAIVVLSPSIAMHMVIDHDPGNSREQYYAGGHVYRHTSDGGWMTFASTFVSPTDIRPLINGMIFMTPGDDAVEGGITYGTFTGNATPPPAGEAVPAGVHCLYDKRTYRLHRCTLEPYIDDIWDTYNDPANAIALPEAARRAVDDGSGPRPMPSVTPSPAAPQ